MLYVSTIFLDSTKCAPNLFFLLSLDEDCVVTLICIQRVSCPLYQSPLLRDSLFLHYTSLCCHLVSQTDLLNKLNEQLSALQSVVVVNSGSWDEYSCGPDIYSQRDGDAWDMVVQRFLILNTKCDNEIACLTVNQAKLV